MATNIKTIVWLNPNIKAYTPLLECIVNSINSIQEKWNKDWEIWIKIISITAIEDFPESADPNKMKPKS